MKESIHFAHGNGFPSRCYAQLLSCLEHQLECSFIDKIGHTSAFPVSDNWHYLVEEIILNVKEQTKTPVIGIGHSMGGVLSLLAAIEQPDLFQAIILLDSPLINRIKSTIVHFSKRIGLIDHLTPAYRTRGRRCHWDTREDVVSYLKRRQLFKYFTEQCLNDYINYGLKHDDTGFSLRFCPEIEYQIYRTIPDNLHVYPAKLNIPVFLIYGNQSKVIDSTDLKHMKKKFGVNCIKTQGTHMFPMEHPEAVADLIFKIIQSLR